MRKNVMRKISQEHTDIAIPLLEERTRRSNNILLTSMQSSTGVRKFVNENMQGFLARRH